METIQDVFNTLGNVTSKAMALVKSTKVDEVTKKMISRRKSLSYKRSWILM